MCPIGWMQKRVGKGSGIAADRGVGSERGVALGTTVRTHVHLQRYVTAAELQQACRCPSSQYVSGGVTAIRLWDG